MAEQTIILGIDPGTNVMGYGLLKVTGKKAELITMGVLDIRKQKDPYEKLHLIFEHVTQLAKTYMPTEMAIEAPFYGKNVQSMLKLGRAQGVAMAAALHQGLLISEYAPLKVKMAITGNGAAAKEQVADMLRRFLHIPNEMMLPQLDATDALAVAYCHFLEMGKPVSDASYHGWKDFMAKNPERIK